MQMNPNNQECFGYFGYGNGFFMREAKGRAVLVSSPRVNVDFCSKCPKNQECWKDLVQTVEIARPDEVQAFHQAAICFVTLGVPEENAGQLVALALQQHGIPDPYLRRMMDNMAQGEQDRQNA
jgi:hypothetical protein